MIFCAYKKDVQNIVFRKPSDLVSMEMGNFSETESVRNKLFKTWEDSTNNNEYDKCFLGWSYEHFSDKVYIYYIIISIIFGDILYDTNKCWVDNKEECF